MGIMQKWPTKDHNGTSGSKPGAKFM
uniref:Uncharacterized protein n=1 Tax=Arundo donax TaxID=35708 RepID=A0A0A9CBI2_ARUDO